MQARATAPTGVTLPLNLGLNDGTYAPEQCLEVFRRFTQRTDLRNYSSADNAPLRHAIAKLDRVNVDNVFLPGGSETSAFSAGPYAAIFLTDTLVLAGSVLVAGAYLLLYRGLELGPVALVSPLLPKTIDCTLTAVPRSSAMRSILR